MGLTAKQSLFVEEYLKDLNATQAAKRAGYSDKTAASIGGENLQKPEIQQAIEEQKAKRIKRTQIDADYVLKQLHGIVDADVLDIVDAQGNMLPVDQWPKIWRQMVNGIEVVDLWERGEQGNKEKIGEITKVKLVDRAKMMKMLGDHVDVGAFAQNLKVSGQVELIDKMKRAQERVMKSRMSVVEDSLDDATN